MSAKFVDCSDGGERKFILSFHPCGFYDARHPLALLLYEDAAEGCWLPGKSSDIFRDPFRRSVDAFCEESGMPKLSAAQWAEAWDSLKELLQESE